MKTKSRNTIFTSDRFNELFCYATSIRETTLMFCNNEISSKEWIDTAYQKETKQTIKSMLRKYGLNKTRSKMRWYCSKFSWMGDWKD